MTITLRLLTTADVEDLHPRLRQVDKDETVCLGSNPREALLMGAFDNIFQASRGRAYALVDADTVIGAVGFSSAGYLWALSTDFSPSQRKELFFRTGELLEKLHSEARRRGALVDIPFFHNIIHSKNRVAIKWLERSGLFMVDRDNPIEHDGEVFYNFRSKMPYELKAPRLGGSLERIPAECVLH